MVDERCYSVEGRLGKRRTRRRVEHESRNCGSDESQPSQSTATFICARKEAQLVHVVGGARRGFPANPVLRSGARSALVRRAPYTTNIAIAAQ